MKKDVTTKYLALFLIVDIIIVGVLLCFFSSKEGWNNWMITPPNVYMILGALFCPMMKKNLELSPNKQTWLLVFKGIKIALTVIMLVLYIFLVKENSKAFVIITAIAYFIFLIVETFSVTHYMKHHLK